MKSYLKLSLWIAAIAIIFTNCSTPTDSLPEEVTENIQKRIEYRLNGAIAIGIIDEDGIRYYNFGSRNSSGAEVNEHSIFEIGSVSKTFTATLLADQVIKGNLSLNDPVNQFLPDSVKVPVLGTQEITLGHLSDHTSGLPRMPNNFNPANPNNPYADYSVAQMYEFISSYAPVREVNAEFEYSNLAVGLLGHVLSLQAGKSYEDILNEVITGPLGMNETKIALDEQMKTNLAEGRNEVGRSVENWDIPTMAGAGAIRSSTSDMIKYLSAHLNYTETPLRKAFDLTYEKRHEKASLWGMEELPVGLSWIYTPGKAGEIQWHTGGTGGYKTYIGLNQSTREGIILLSTGSRPTEIGLYLSGISDSLSTIEPPLAIALMKKIDNAGVDAAKVYFEDTLINNLSEYNYDEDRINALGYAHLGDNIDAAITIFEINIRLFPDAWNPYAL